MSGEAWEGFDRSACPCGQTCNFDTFNRACEPTCSCGGKSELFEGPFGKANKVDGEETIFEGTDDFGDKFSVMRESDGSWIAEVVEEDAPVVRRFVVLRRPQVEELFVSLGRSLEGDDFFEEDEPIEAVKAERARSYDFVTAQVTERTTRARAEREAADAAALRRVNDKLRAQIKKLGKEPVA